MVVSAASCRIADPPVGQREVALASLRLRASSTNLRPVALRCLLIDDNEAFLASASRLLAADGVDVVGRASSAAEAMRVAAAAQPDVALVDVQLGDEDGLEVARQLAAAARPIPVILISTHAAADLAELIADTPAIGFLGKSDLSGAAVAELLR
jgi:DNA-binding NarL/FixJ family response regulator